MTVSSTVNREQYTTDGVTDAFAIHFPFFNDTDVNAILVDAAGNATTLSLNADFTVTGGSGSGGSLLTTTAPPGGGTLTIYRDIPFTQEDDYVENDPLPANTLEGGFDRAVIRDQQLRDALDRSLTFPPTVAPGVSGELPNPAAGEFLRFRADGSGLESSPIAGLGAVGQATEAEAGIGRIATDGEMIAGTAGRLADARKVRTFYDAQNRSKGRHMIWVAAAAMFPAVTNGPSAGVTETAVGKVNFKTLDYDQSSIEIAWFAISMPKSWDKGTVSFEPVWTASAGSGVVEWHLGGVAVGNDDALDSSIVSEQASLDALTSIGDLCIGPESPAIAIGGTPQAGDTVFLRIYRVANATSDTLNADAKLIGIRLYITTDAETDA